MRVEDGYSEVTKAMQNYYSLYTWAMDRQASLEREAARHRMSRTSRHSRWSLRWPIVRQEVQTHDHHHDRHQPGAAA